MRALVYLGPGRMELQDVPDPQPGPGEVSARVGLAAICGSDLHGFREASPRRIPPLVMGHEAVGVVDAVGEGVDGGRAGERVVLKPILGCGACARCARGEINLCRDAKLVGRDLPGAFAERFVIPENGAVPFRNGMSDETALLIEPLANCVRIVGRSVRPGNDVLVIGAGAIGLLVARVARLVGARTVIAVDRLPARLELAKAQGVDVVVRAEDDPAEAALSATHGEGAEVVVDAVGVPSTVALAQQAVAVEGRIELLGLGAAEGVLNYHLLMDKHATIAGSFAWTEEDFDASRSMLEAGLIDPAGWFTRMPLADGQRAFEELVAPETKLLKVALEP